MQLINRFLYKIGRKKYNRQGYTVVRFRYDWKPDEDVIVHLAEYKVFGLYSFSHIIYVSNWTKRFSPYVLQFRYYPSAKIQWVDNI